ncbi:HXXEE domain-containing protein [Streptomyces sp. NPDC002004]
MSEHGVGPEVTYGLFVAWALHDAEELATMGRWTRTAVPRLRERYPAVPERVWRAVGSVDGREFAVAVGAMAAIVGSAAIAGQRSGGRSAWYQTMVNAFGLHGLVHLAQAAAVRGYTPGSVTSPILVVPFTVWARHRLGRAGVLRPTRPRDAVVGLAAAGASAVAAHAVARRVLGRRVVSAK